MKNKSFYFIFIVFIFGGYIFLQNIPTRPSSEFSKSKMLRDKVWTLSLNRPVETTPLSIEDNIVVRTDHDIYSLNKNNGVINWKTPSKAYSSILDSSAIQRPIIGNLEFLVTAEKSNSLSIYSSKTGSPLWNIAQLPSSINDLSLLDNILLLAGHDTNLTAYDISSKISLWEVKVPYRSGLSVAANSNYAVLSADNWIRIYDLQTGDLLREKKYEALTGELIMLGNTIYLCYVENLSWYVVSTQLDSLTDNWIFKAGDINHPYITTANDELYIYNHNLIAINKNNGELLWRDDTQGVYSAPVAYEKTLYYFFMQKGSKRSICSLDIKTGNKKECVTLYSTSLYEGNQLEAISPLIVEDTLIISQGSEISAYRLEP